MALVKIALRKYGEAVDYARRAAAAAPGNSRYSYTLGLAREKAGDMDGAVAAYKASAEKDPRYLRPRINLGLLYLENGFPNEALDSLMEAWRVEPASFEVNNNLGNVYARLESWDEAVRRYEAALAAQPGNVTSRMNLARAHVGARNLTRARDVYLEVTRLAPNNDDALFELGKTCAGMGDADSARRYLAALLEKNPGHSGKAEAEKILASL
ncbi:MAG: tetratricopeptide repeat protein [Treponema sp.]|nr:tetratricopeptide repeat protein [Treponema sp.]